MDNYKRSNWIDFCRGGGIGLVLLGHTSFPFHKFIYGFHMPLFFLISGLLWHEERSIPYKKYAKRFLIPYAGFAALNFIADIVLHLRDLKSYPYEKKVIGILYSRGTTEWMPNCSPLWFLTCMFMGMSLLYIISQLIMFLLPVRLSTQQVTVFHSTSRLDSEPDAKRSLCGLVACNGVSPPLKTNQLLQWVCVVLCASASVLLGVLGAPKHPATITNGQFFS